MEEFRTGCKAEIGEEGIFQKDLVDVVHDEFGGNKEVIRRKISKFVSENDEYETIGKRTENNQLAVFIRRR